MSLINWNNVQLIADKLQDEVFTEQVTIHHVGAQVSDDPHSEPETEPTPTDIQIECGVKPSTKKAEIQNWGQEINADYLLIITIKALDAAGVNIDSLIKDTCTVRGDSCIISKAPRKTGWNGSGYTWLTIPVTKEND